MKANIFNLMLLHLLPNIHKYPFINKLRRGSLITGESHYISSTRWIIELLVVLCSHCKFAHKLNFGGAVRGQRTHQSNQAPAPPPPAAQPSPLFWLGCITTPNKHTLIGLACWMLRSHNVLAETGVEHLWSPKRQMQPVNTAKQIRGRNTCKSGRPLPFPAAMFAPSWTF